MNTFVQERIVPQSEAQVRLDERQHQTRCECQYNLADERVYTCPRCEELEKAVRQ